MFYLKPNVVRNLNYLILFIIENISAFRTDLNFTRDDSIVISSDYLLDKPGAGCSVKNTTAHMTRVKTQIQVVSCQLI